MDTEYTTQNRLSSSVFARLLLALAAILAALSPAAPALAHSVLAPDVVQVFVDDDYDSSTPGWNVDRFDEIQKGIDAVDAGGFVDVSPGNYEELIEISKSLTLRGAQFNVDPRPTGTGNRPGGESVLRTPVFKPYCANIITVKANNVTIDGFTFNGNNPALGDVGEEINGVSLHIGGGVANGTDTNPSGAPPNPECVGYINTISSLVISNNVFKNLNLYGVTISSSSGAQRGNHVVDRNVFDNMAGGITPHGSRRAIRLSRNQYGVITNNEATRVRVGIEITGYDRANPGSPVLITNNDVEFVRDGIWFNGVLNGSSPMLVEDNIFRTMPGGVNTRGIRLNNIKGSAEIRFQDNTVTSGAVNGVWINNLNTTEPLRFTNLIVQSPVTNGVLFENLVADTQVDNAAAKVVIESSAIDGGETGVSILDNLDTSGLPEIVNTLVMTVTNDTVITGGDKGIVVDGPDATLRLFDNDGGDAISDNGIGVEVSNLARINALRNKIDGNETGLRILNGAFLTNLRQNWITDNTNRGVVISGTVGGGGNIFNNDISGNGNMGALNVTGSTIDMAGNHWGSSSPGAVASEVSGNVDYSPYLNLNTDVSSDAGFQGDFSSLTVDDLAVELSASALQEGITMAVAPGTVNVATGVYPTGVTINKDVNLVLGGPVTISGDVSQLQGTLTASPSALILLGNLLRSGGTFNANNGSVLLQGTSLQMIGGTSSTEFYDLVAANPAGTGLAGSVRVSHQLALQSSVIDVNAYDLTLGAGATVAGGAPGVGNMIAVHDGGRACKEYSGPGSFTFPIGDVTGAANYSPATVQLSGGTYSNGVVCADVADARYPHNFASSHLTRYWTLASSGINGYSANLTFNYASDGEDVTGTESALIEMEYNGTALIYQGDPVNTASNSMQIGTSNLNGRVYTAGNRQLVNLLSMTITRETLTRSRIAWTVGMEDLPAGGYYQLLRSTTPDGTRTPIGTKDPTGPSSSYFILDTTIQPGNTYYYWLKAVVDGTGQNDILFGPYALQWTKIYLPIALVRPK